MNELGDLKSATAQLGFVEKSQNGARAPVAAESASTNSALATSNIITPATSVAPSIAGGNAAKTKLPLAIRKEVRDNFESKLPQLEANFSSVLGQPWQIEFGAGHPYSLAEELGVKECPGQTFANATEGISDCFQRYDAPGKSELNALASSHTMTLEQTTSPEISSSRFEISGGMLRLHFGANQLSYNIGLVCSELSKAVNDADVSSNPSVVAALDFDAKSSIKSEYEPAIGDAKAKILSILGLPTLELQPNFERNFAAIAAYTTSGKQSTPFPRESQKRLGRSTLKYVEGLIEALEKQGFAKDDMPQEGY